jgi:two-component system, NarL family, nitrate/nitrite response regulator NarL
MSVVVQPINILLIGEHALVRAALRLLLESRPGLHVVAEAVPDAWTLTAATCESPDIIFLDLDLALDQHGTGALTLIPELRTYAPKAQVLLLTALHDPQIHSAAVHVGAMGLVWKDSKPAELWNAIEKVYKGEAWLGRMLMASVLSTMTHRGEPEVTDPEAMKLAALTAREREVIGLVGDGLKNQVIAQRLYISEATVRHHITSIFAKLGVADRFALALYAYRHGLARLPCSSPIRN